MDPLQNLAGTLLIGYLLNLFLLGVLVVQIFIYSFAFTNALSRENTGLKCLVYAVFIMEILQSALIMRDAFVTFVSGLGNRSELGNVNFTWLTMPILSGIVGATVECFFAFRIYILSGQSYIFPLLIVLLAITQCTASIAVGIDEYHSPKLGVFTQVGTIGNIIWPLVSSICDIIVAFATSYYMRKLNKELKDLPEGFMWYTRPTRTILGRALYLGVETGALTASLSTVYFILWFWYPQNHYYMAFAFLMGGIYANSLMVIFNSRTMISDRRAEPQIAKDVEANLFKEI